VSIYACIMQAGFCSGTFGVGTSPTHSVARVARLQGGVREREVRAGLCQGVFGCVCIMRQLANAKGHGVDKVELD